MKLRNKKTGKIIESECITMFGPSDGSGACRSIKEFYTLAELNEEWEDYEPLILDELDRKIIRLWAHNNKLKTVISYGHDAWIGLRGVDSQGNIWKIELNSMFSSQLEDGKSYSIDDLCGAEEK